MPCIKNVINKQPINLGKHKFYRNKITHLKESLKQNYYRSKFENFRNDVEKPGKF